MPSWNDVLEEVNGFEAENPFDYVRRKYLQQLHDKTGRNVIAYYSGWLQKPQFNKTDINDEDKNGFMTTVHGLDRSKGLDIILHTPGGNTAATESLVDYLRKMFGTNIRAIVPQLAMSAGTMVACSCKEIIMGKQSSLGPIDPQFSGISAEGVIEEFNKAIEEVKRDPATIPIWQTVVAKYHPTFIGECEKAMTLSKHLVESWLVSGMFKKDPNAESKASRIVTQLNSHTSTKTHERHIPIDDCRNYGLKIISLEDDQTLQDIVLTIHHAYMISFTSSTAIKIIENHEGKAMVVHGVDKTI